MTTVVRFYVVVLLIDKANYYSSEKAVDWIPTTNDDSQAFIRTKSDQLWIRTSDPTVTKGSHSQILGQH